MNEPTHILPNFTRIVTSNPLGSTGGFIVAQKHMEMRKPGAVGVICGIVGGHGGDVYWVSHLGDSLPAPYGWMEFELAPVENPCGQCQGTGTDWYTSRTSHTYTPCVHCHGTACRSAGL